MIGHEIEIGLPCLGIPANKIIPGGALPGCRPKKETGKGILLPVENHVLHVLSYCAETQIMVSSKQGLKESQKTGPLNQLDAYRLKVAQGADRRGFMRDKRSRDLAATPARGSLPRQGNMATLFKRSVRQAMSLIWPLGACQFQRRHNSLES